MPEQASMADTFTANPQITEVEIGIRSLRKITLYPLSMADQLKTTDLISQALTAFAARTDLQNDMEFVSLIVGIVKENILRILEMVTDEKGEELAKDITNVQAARIAEVVYDVNFGEALKNAQSLVEKVKAAFPSMRQPLTSVNTMAGTDLKTFTGSPLNMGEQPSANSS